MKNEASNCILYYFDLPKHSCAIKIRYLALDNLKKNYYTTHAQYMENRCQTFEQRSFNFVSGAGNAPYKPGSALAISNEYIANCYPNTGLSTFTQLELVAQAFQMLNNDGVFSTGDITNYYNYCLYLLWS